MLGLHHNPIASRNIIAHCHQRFVPFVHNTELQILHVTILKFERRSLEPKLSNFLTVCSKVLLRSSVQLLHPNCRRNTHRQSTSNTTRANRQIDFPPTQRRHHRHKVSTLAGFPPFSCLFLDSFPGSPLPMISFLLYASVHTCAGVRPIGVCSVRTDGCGRERLTTGGLHRSRTTALLSEHQ